MILPLGILIVFEILVANLCKKIGRKAEFADFGMKIFHFGR